MLRLLLLSVLCFTGLPRSRADDFASLFNGKDLTGWEGDPKHWSVKDGAITGVTEGNIPKNSFIVWTGGELENFDLRLKVRIVGNNSGINYRSKRLREVGPYVVAGYQADIDVKSAYTGQLYEERGRTFLALCGQKVIIDAEGNRHIVGSLGEREKLLEGVDYSQWNDYAVIAKGNHLVHIFNGKKVLELIDHESKKRALKGILGFQVHVGPAMEVQYKDIRLKKLPPGGILTAKETPIPDGSKKIPAGALR